MPKYTLGVDYGTDSVRTILVDASNGNEIAGSVFYYPRWKAGKYCDPLRNRFRQHPLDYIEGLETTVREVLGKAPAGVAGDVVAISVDTTGSTPVAVDRTEPHFHGSGMRESECDVRALESSHGNTEAERSTRYPKRGGIAYTDRRSIILPMVWLRSSNIIREDRWRMQPVVGEIATDPGAAFGRQIVEK
jgi:L-ribulokinase